MPEGPELHLAARFVNEVSQGVLFKGKIQKSSVSNKNPDVSFTAGKEGYSLKAEARGKEMKVMETKTLET